MKNSRLCGFPLSENCGTAQSLQTDDDDDKDDYEFPITFTWILILARFASGFVFWCVMGNILMDRQPWLTGEIVHNFDGMQNNNRRPKWHILYTIFDGTSFGVKNKIRCCRFAIKYQCYFRNLMSLILIPDMCAVCISCPVS